MTNTGGKIGIPMIIARCERHNQKRWYILVSFALFSSLCRMFSVVLSVGREKNYYPCVNQDE